MAVDCELDRDTFAGPSYQPMGIYSCNYSRPGPARPRKGGPHDVDRGKGRLLSSSSPKILLL